MAASSPLVRLRRLALPLALVALCAAAAHGQTLTSAFLTSSTSVTVTLSNSTGPSSDCRNAFSYFDLNNGTKASPFANCTANGTFTVLLTLASAGTYAAGDQLNIKVNQTTLNTTAGAPFVAAAVAVAVPPVVGAATLTASRTVVVKLPLSGNTVPDSFATNMTVCGGAVELRAAGASAAKVAPFEACSLAADVLTLTLKSAGTYAPGDTVNVVNGQSTLRFGTTAYAPLASGSVIRPTLTSVSLSSTTTILIGTSGPASLPGNASAAVCNAVFDIALKNGTVLPGALSACSVGPGVTAITAALANGTAYSDGMTVTLKANQTALKAGDQTAAAPLFVPPTAALAIAPTILSASLTAADTITVVLPVASSLDTSACNSAFELRAAASSTAKSSPFSACSLAVNNTQAVLTLASASTYTSGDILDIKSGNDKLLAGSTAYVPQSVTVLPTITTATLVSSTVVRVALPVVSSIPAPYSADDCARSIVVAAASSTAAKAISACALSADKKALLVTLAAAYQPGDTVNVRTGQWQLRAGASVTLGPNYIASAAPAPILPGLSAATLTSATQVVVTLPAASSVPATFSVSDCNAAVDLVSAAGASKDTPFAACALGSGNATLILNLTASAYAIGDTVSVKASQTTLKVGNTSYTPYSVPITPVLLPTTTAVLVSETSISVTLPTGFNSYLPSTANASDCNAAFVLVSATGTAKTAPYTSCTVSGTTLTLGVAAGTYAAGDSVNVKTGNSLFLGASSTGPAYVPAVNATQITPTIVAASLVSTTNVFVTLSAAASPSAFNGTLCNDALEVTGGSATVFLNCTLTSDGKGINLLLSTASSVSTSNTINVKASQTMLKAAGSDAASSPAFARLGSPIAVADARLNAAFLTSASTIVAKLGARAVASDGFSCNSVFALLMTNGSVRASSPFTACTLSTDGLTATLTTTTYVSNDRLNVRSSNTIMTVLAATGPNYPNVSADASAVTINPAISSAMATSATTVIVPLPIASNLAGACSGALEVKSSGGTSKTVDSCTLNTAKTQLTVTLNSGTPFAQGDTIAILSANTGLTATDASGAPYRPVTGASAITIAPTVGTAQAISSTTITVVLPATTNAASTLTADACASAIDVSGKSFSSCTISGTTLTIVLAGTYAASDRINVKADQKVLRLGTGASAAYYVPLPSSAAVIPTIASAKAISRSVIIATLPVGSTFVSGANASVAVADQTLCAAALSVVSTLLTDAGACNLTSSTSLRITLAAATYNPGDAITVADAQTALYAGTGLVSGQTYQNRALKISPAYLLSTVVATASDTIVVTLPVESTVFDSTGTQITADLTGDQCASIVEVKAGTTAKKFASCAVSGVSSGRGTVLTVKLLGNTTDVYASGDTFNFKDTNALLLAGTTSAAVAYAALPTAATIAPTIVSAVALTADTIRITLPSASGFMVSGAASTTIAAANCDFLVFNPVRTAKTDTACNITGSTLTITLNTAITGTTTVNIVTSQTKLVAGTGTSGPAFVPAGSPIAISPGFLTSPAVARSLTQLVVSLPFTSNVGASASWTGTQAQCNSVVEVLAGGVEGSLRTLHATTNPCVLSGGNVLTLNLAATDSFAPGDTVRIKSGNTRLLMDTAGTAPYVQGTAVPITLGAVTSAVATKDTEIVVTLPMTVALVKAGAAVTQLGKTDCLLVVTLAGTIADVATACVLTGGNKLTITTTGSYTPGTTTVQFGNTDASVKLLTGAGLTGPAVVALSSVQSVNPGYISSAATSTASQFVITLPQQIGATGTITQVNCDAALEVLQANGTTRVLSGDCTRTTSGGVSTITVPLTTNIAIGDTVRIKASSSGITTATGSLQYAATAAVPIQPGHVSYAAAIATDKFVVTLPYASTLAAGAVCSDTVNVKSDTNANVETGCTLSLDSTGIYLTVDLADTNTLVATFKVTFKSAQTALTVGTTKWAPLSAGVYSLDSATWGTSVMKVVAVSSTVIEVTLPMVSYLGELSATACGQVITVAGNTLASSGTACKLISTPTGTNNIMQVTLQSAYVAGGLQLTNTGGALKAGSSTGTAYGAVAAVTIKPTFASAVATGLRTVVVTLPATSTVYKLTPTCTGTGASGACSTGTPTCASGSPACSDGTGTYSCTSSTPSTCADPTTSCAFGTKTCAQTDGSFDATQLTCTTAVAGSMSAGCAAGTAVCFDQASTTAAQCASTATTDLSPACTVANVNTPTCVGGSVTSADACLTYAGSPISPVCTGGAFACAAAAGPMCVQSATPVCPSTFSSSCSSGSPSCTQTAGLTTPGCTSGGTLTCSKTATCDAEAATPTCAQVFATFTGGASVTTCTNPSSDSTQPITTTLTLGADWALGDKLTVNAAQATTTATSYLKAGTATGLVYTSKPSGDVVIYPSITLAVLTSSKTITVTLPVAASVPSTGLSAADCNNIFTLYAGATAKSNVFAGCSLAADKVTFTLTLVAAASATATTTTYAAGDFINIKSGQSLLKADSTTAANRLAFAPHPDGLPVVATIVSAVVTAGVGSGTGIVRVQLPIASDLAKADCDNTDIGVLDNAGTAQALAGTGGCALSTDKTVLTITLAGSVTASWFTTSPYMRVRILSQATLGLKAGSSSGYAYITTDTSVLATVRAFDVASATPQSIVSATAVGPTRLELALPAVTTINPANGCPSSLTLSRTLSNCSLDDTGKLLTVFTTAAYQSADTVQVVASQALKYMAGDTATSYPALGSALTIAPAIVSAYTVDASTIAVTLPVASSFYVTTTRTATLDAVDCDKIITVLKAGVVNGAGAIASAGNRRTLLTTGACTLGTASAGGTTITVKLSGAIYDAGDAVDIPDTNAGLNGATATSNPLYADSNSGPKYVARRSPVVIEPRLVSASAVGAQSVEVVLPAASAIIDSSNAVVATPSSSQCAAIAVVSGKTVTSCSLSTDGLTLTLGLSATFAPGDTVNIVSGQTMLRVWKASVGAGYEAFGPVYTPSAAALAITIGYFVSAYAPDTQTVVITLPFTAKLYDYAPATGASTAEITRTATAPTKGNCDSIVRIASRTLASTPAALTDPTCTLSGTTLTVKLASTTLSAGDQAFFGSGTDAILRGVATGTVGLTSTTYLTTAATTATTGAVTIHPSVTSAIATDSTTIKVTLPFNAWIHASITSLNASDCGNLLTFTPAKTLAAASSCSFASNVITVKLSGDGTSGTFASGDTVNIAAANAATLTYPLRAGSSSGPLYGPGAAVTIVPKIAAAQAIAPLTVEITLSAPSYLPDALTQTECAALLTFTPSKTLFATTPCALDSTKTVLTVKLASGSEFANGDQVNIHATTNTGTKALRAGSDVTGLLYTASDSPIDINPAIQSAAATSATSIAVTLPVGSTLYVSGATASISAADCAKVLEVKRGTAALTLESSAACAIATSGSSTTLTVTLASGQAFAAGDTVNIVAANSAGTTTTAVLQATNGGSGKKYVARRSAVVIAPGYLGGVPATGMAYAVGTSTLMVQLPVVSSIAADNNCANVVTVQKIATPATARTVTGACTVSSSQGAGYYLIVNAPYTPGDEILIKTGNTALVGGSDPATGAPYVATTALPIRANFDDAILTAPTTVLVTLAAPTAVSLPDKEACDAVFVFSGAGNTTKTTSPIASCSRASDGLSVTITLTSADAYVPGDALDIKKNQAAATVGSASDTPSTLTTLVPLPVPTTISPRPFGAAATLVAPTSVAFSLPAVSSLPAATAAADCNAAVRYTDVAGVDAVNPFTSCALTPDTKGVALNTASPIYKAGDVMNIKWTNTVLRWGPQASGAAYYPADADVPVFATVATATLVDPSTVVVNLPAPSAVPDNFTVPDCLRAIEFKTAAGVTKNGTVASCMLMPDRLGLQVKLLSAGNFSAGDTVNIKPQQAELRVSALATGPSYVPKLAAQVVNPALFANANLTSATAITVRLPFASTLATGADCKAVLALLGAGGVAKNVSSCSLGADGVTLAVTIPAASFVGGDVLNIVPGQRALTLADGTTAYVPSKAGVLVTPNIVSATLTNATIVTVALPTASVLTSTAAADCNAAVVIARNGSAVASPLSACAVSADGLSLTLTAAATYKPMSGDTVDVAVSQTVLRAGSATGPAYVPRPSPALITVPSPPPSPPPSPAPSPPPSPPLSTANYSARGLATGPLSCNVLIGDLTVTTTSGNFTGMASYAGKDASYKGSCKDAVTGAVYTDDTVASTLPAGLTGLVLSPVTALASVWDLKSVADLANTNKDYLRLLGVPVNASAYGTAVQLLAYDYYVKGFVALETPAVAVLNVEGMVAANLLMYTKFFDGLNASVAGRDITAAQALAAGQYALAAVLEDSSAPINTTDPASILALLNVTYSVLTANATSAGRRLLQTAPAPFTQLQAQATALAAAAAGSNALVAAQQARLITAINAGTSISAAELTNIINEASKVIVAQSTVIATAASGLGSGAISPASFTSSYTGSALTTLVAQQQLAATPGSDVTAGPAPSPPSDKKKSNTGLIVGLVVGLVGGAIVITLIVVFIVMRRRKQNVAAAGQATA